MGGWMDRKTDRRTDRKIYRYVDTLLEQLTFDRRVGYDMVEVLVLASALPSST